MRNSYLLSVEPVDPFSPTTPRTAPLDCAKDKMQLSRWVALLAAGTLPAPALCGRCYDSSIPGCGTCLNNPTRASFLQGVMHAARMVNGAQQVMLVKDWPSHMIVSNVSWILIEEVLGYSDVLNVDFQPSTLGSFQKLAEETAQMDMELWASSDAGGYATFAANYTHAGTSFDYARSGLYLRPSQAHAAQLVSKGRFYSHFMEVVWPLLPTVEEVYHLCKLSLQQHCVEMPNRNCFAGGCKALLKATDLLDAGIVETMIANASLPLAIVYTGFTEADYLYGAAGAGLFNRTLLFYSWEPYRSVVRPEAQLIRLDFDPPVACERNVSATAYPSIGMACDFPTGGAHKGLSPTVARKFSDIRTLVSRLQLSTADINKMELAHLHNRNWSGAACEWVRRAAAPNPHPHPNLHPNPSASAPAWPSLYPRSAPMCTSTHSGCSRSPLLGCRTSRRR